MVAPLAPRRRRRCTFTAAFAMRCFRAGEGAGRSSGLADEREWVGRFLGRIHAVGRSAPFRERATPQRRGAGPQGARFRARGRMAARLSARRSTPILPMSCSRRSRRGRAAGGGAALGRILGDCHRGNILWTDLGPHFVDLDDCLTGPAIQDLWMLLAGSRQEMRTQLTDLLKGYEQFLPFDRRELALIEPLRALRMIHYSAWLARRWDDPAFPKAFPWFAEPRYWEEHYRALEEQLGGGARSRRSSCESTPDMRGIIGAMMNPRVLGAVRGGRCWPPATAIAGPAPQPTPAAQKQAPSAKAAAAKTPQQLTADMVEAASQGKSQAPVTLKFDLLQRPTVGQPLEVALALLPQIAGGTGRHRCHRLGQPAGGGRRQPDRNRRRRARAGLPAQHHGHADRRGDAVRQPQGELEARRNDRVARCFPCLSSSRRPPQPPPIRSLNQPGAAAKAGQGRAIRSIMGGFPQGPHRDAETSQHRHHRARRPRQDHARRSAAAPVRARSTRARTCRSG